MAVSDITGYNEHEQSAEAASMLDPADIIDDLREPLEAAASDSLGRALDRAADALFTRAGREETEALRNSCHSAVRALKHHRQAINEHFRKVLDERFQCGFDRPGRALSLKGATLATREDVKDDTIIENTAERIRTKQRTNLAELERYLDHAVPGDPSGENNPFDPLVLVRAFGEALAQTNIETRPRLVVYRAFEDELTGSLDTAYRTLITELKAAGVTATIESDTNAARHLEETESGGDVSWTNPADDSVAQSTVNQPGSTTATTVDSQALPSVDESTADAQDRVRLVRQHIRVLVEARLGREPNLPEEVCRFLRQAWTDVMLINGIRYGVNSESWHEHKRVLEWLIWVMRPHSDAADLEASGNELPEVLERVQEMLGAVMRDGGIISDLIDHLIDAYSRANGAPAAEPEPSEESRAVVSSADGGGNNVLVGDFVGGASDAGSSDQEMNEDDEIRRELATVPVCSWFEFIRDDGERLQACLQARLEGGRRYIFADRHGEKVADYSIDELAEAVAEGNAAPLDDVVLVETDEGYQEG